MKSIIPYYIAALSMMGKNRSIEIPNFKVSEGTRIKCCKCGSSGVTLHKLKKEKGKYICSECKEK